MAEVRKLETPVDRPAPTVTVGQRLWLTADDEVVADGDPRAVRGLCAAGDELPRKVAERYGLVGPGPLRTAKPPEPQPDDEEPFPGGHPNPVAEPAEAKEAAKPADKAKKKPADKAAADKSKGG